MQHLNSLIPGSPRTQPDLTVSRDTPSSDATDLSDRPAAGTDQDYLWMFAATGGTYTSYNRTVNTTTCSSTTRAASIAWEIATGVLAKCFN